MTIQEKERAATRSYSGRYDAVNFQPRHTVEFRQFRGTLRAETILASILFVDELLHFCRRHTTEEIVAEDGWKKFMRSVNKSNRAGIEILKDYLQERLDVHYLHS